MNGETAGAGKEIKQGRCDSGTRFCRDGRRAAYIADVLFGVTTRQANCRYPSRVRWDKFRSITAISIQDAHGVLKKPNKYTSRYFDEANGRSIRFGYGLSYTIYGV